MLTFIDKLKAKKVESASIVELLDKKLSGVKAERSHKTIHVSDLTRDIKFCPREFALLDALNKRPKPRFISTAMQVAFDNGNALHDLTRNVWLADDVVGTWACRGCSFEIVFSKRPKNSCPKCRRALWAYREEQFIDPHTGVSGSIDFFLDLGNGKHTVCECKSISKDDFSELKAPLGEHRIRSQLYLLVISRSGRDIVPQIDLSHARVLYISKGYGKKSEEYGKVLPFREFVVPRDDAAAMPYLKTALPVKKYREGGVMPSGVCNTGMDTRAKMCGCAKECFSGKYPAGG